MDARLLGSLFRLRGLALKFGHFWSYAVAPEDLAEIYHHSANFAEFQEKLREMCISLNIAPVGGRYLEDARIEDGWLTAVFGSGDQLRVSLTTAPILIRAEYVNGNRYASALYDDVAGDLTWESPPQTARDAVRILKVIAVLAECNPKHFVNTHLPAELDNDEAALYMSVPSWAYLWISPAVLEDILPAC